jgi:hypothetical protein
MIRHAAVLVVLLGCGQAAASPARHATPGPAPATVLTCRGVLMGRVPRASAAVALEVRAASSVADATVRLSVDGGAPRTLRAGFEVRQQWLRLGFRATLTATLVEPSAGRAVGTLAFDVTIRDNDAAMPAEAELLRGRPFLALGSATARELTCTRP